METMHTLSVIIIARDEADRIRPCLESVQEVADEIIVIDSGSTDETVSVAREYTEKVFTTDWPGDGIQKQRALDRASGDWVFRIDADERMSAELRTEIAAILALDTIREVAFKVPWATWFFGRYLTHGEAGVSHLNLFRRQGARYDPQLRHARLRPARGPIGKLKGRLYHDSWRDMRHLLDKLTDYACTVARQRAEAGERSGAAIALLHALGRFIKAYLLRGGFLDGGRGFIMATLFGQYAFNKYAALWAEGQPDPPSRDTG
jgi:glycosyltransferase involved in cell wall biosynthesis